MTRRSDESEMTTERPHIFDRRRFLRALGLGGVGLAGGGAAWSILERAGLLPEGRAAAGGAEPPPTRVVFFITPHGTVWDSFHMNVPGLTAATSRASLVGLPDSTWSTILRPLAPHANDLMVVEGLARTAAIEYEHRYAPLGESYDLNRHHFGQAMLLTCQEPMQRAGSTCIGGAISVDQVIGAANAVPGRWASRVYGANHQHAYTFVSAGVEASRVDNPRQAFNDVLGLYTPPPGGGGPTRDERIRAGRASALALARYEYDLVAPRVGAMERVRLEAHRDLIADLERTFGGGTGFTGTCDPGSYSAVGHYIDQFARVIALTLACDMTRVITFPTPNLNPEEFGLPAGTNVHQDYAHNSVASSGGSAYTPEAARGMTEYNLFYARRFAYLLEQLDSIPEADGTVLDHTMVVWMSELGTGTHELRDLPIVIGGGGSGFLGRGRYVRYARDATIEAGWGRETVGPSQTQLYITLMRAMGMSDETFGMTSVPRVGGGTLELRGVLPELLA